VLLHLVSAREDDPAVAYRTVRNELVSYAHGLAEKPEIVALSQIDILDAEERAEKMAALQAECGQQVLALSAATGEGVEAAQRGLMDKIAAARQTEAGPAESDQRWQPEG
jgi:GTPase